MAEERTFTHVGVKKTTQRKISLLANAQDVDIYALVEYWANEDWNLAVKNGLVTDAMLEKQPNSARNAAHVIISTDELKKARKPATPRPGALLKAVL